MKFVILWVLFFIIGIFLFWYSGVNIFQRSNDAAWAIFMSLGAAFVAALIIYGIWRHEL